MQCRRSRLGSARPPRRLGAEVRARGFTLVELVLAMAILGSLAAVAGPRFFGTGDLDARLFFDDTQSAVRYAQKLAVATGCETQVAIAASSYSLSQRSGCAAGAFDQAVVHPGTGRSGYVGSAPPGVTLTTDVNPFRFDSLGRARDSLGAVRDVSLSVGVRSFSVAGETGFVGAP